MDVFEEIYKKKEFDDQGIDYEFDITDGVMKIMVKDPEPTRLQEIGKGFQKVGSAVTGIGGGVGAATLGLVPDLFVALPVAVKDALTAEDGKKLKAFGETFERLSKENLGSEFYRGLFNNAMDSLDLSEELKQDAKSGFNLGEFFDLLGPVGVAKASKIAKSLTNKLGEVGEAAQKRVDESPGSATVSSMGVGEMGKMVDKGLSKLAPNKGEVVNLKPKTDRLNFYSKAEEVTNQLKQNKGTGQQYRQQLLKAGVKPDEIEWLGLDDVLKKGKITKQELQDQINANRIELDEVELSGSADDVLDGLPTRFMESERPMSADDAFGPEYLNNRADEIFQDYELKGGDTTKFTIDDAYERAKNEYTDVPIMKYVDPETGYTITGNYDVGYSIFRSEADSSSFRNAIGYNERNPSQSEDVPFSLNEAIVQAQRDMREIDFPGMYGERPAMYEDFTEPGGSNYREFLIKYENPDIAFGQEHFDDMNVIAHFRTKDRTTSDGKKVFYIEEIQSDWGQTYRKEQSYMPNIQDTSFEEYERRVLDNTAPPAPFITDTDKWTQLTLKRILSKAVDEGYDFVSITPGKAQMDRWRNEGVAKFYDEIVPKNAEKIVKKLDKNAIQKDKKINYNEVRQGTVYNQERFSIELTPQLKEKVKKGMAMFSATPLVVGQENE